MKLIPRRGEKRCRAVSTLATYKCLFTYSSVILYCSVGSWSNAFLLIPPPQVRNARHRCSTTVPALWVYAPPGSGYATPEDEVSELPDTYEPMMEYPGTMRPGRTPENQPFHDLPLADDAPDPVPWPHFQQIEWHHRWDPPHPHPIPMEEFIEMHGRWATPEMEAAMRAGIRRDVRQQREQAEAEKRETLIVDDDDDEEDDLMERDEPVELGDGVFGKLGSAADQAVTAAAVSGRGNGATTSTTTTTLVETEESMAEDDFDDFLLDLGLDATPMDSDDDDDDRDEEDDDDADDIKSRTATAKTTTKGGLSRRSKNVAATATSSKGRAVDEDDGDLDLGDLDLLVGDDGDDADDVPIDIMDLDDSGDMSAGIDDDLGLGLDDDDLTEDGVATVPLDDFDGETLDAEEDFFDSGFDYDDDDGFDAGDMW